MIIIFKKKISIGRLLIILAVLFVVVTMFRKQDITITISRDNQEYVLEVSNLAELVYVKIQDAWDYTVEGGIRLYEKYKKNEDVIDSQITEHIEDVTELWNNVKDIVIYESED